MLIWTESAPADATENLGKRIRQAMWYPWGTPGQVILETSAHEAVKQAGNADAVGALRHLAPAPATRLTTASVASAAVTASGNRVIAGQTIATAITGRYIANEK